MSLFIFALKGFIVALIAGLDKLVCPQFMICRPIVAAPLTGLVLGDIQTGLSIGLTLELLWLAVLPLGATLPPDDTLLAVCSTVITLWLSTFLGITPLDIFALPVLVAIPLCRMGRFFEHKVRSANDSLLTTTNELEPSEIDLIHFKGILRFALAITATYILIISIGSFTSLMVAKLFMPTIAKSNHLVKFVFPFIGAALFISKVHIKRATTLFVASFSMVTLIVWLT